MKRQTTYCMACSMLALLLLIAPAGSAGAVQQAAESQPELLVYKKTTDAKDKAVELKLHMYKPKGWSKEDKRPAVVFFFGGGWMGGSPKQFYPHCEQLASLGMVAFSAEYRVKRAHGTDPQQCVEDGKSAVRYLRKHASELGIDPDRIVAGGGSAGGHVAASTGVLIGFDAKDEDAGVSSRPNLMVLFNPVLDTSLETGYGGSRIKPDPKALSPVHHVHKAQPPAIVFHGDADTTVPIRVAKAFDQRCKAVSAECVLRSYEGAGHGFFNHSRFRKPREGSPDYYKLTMQAAVAFLRQHGYIEQGDE